MKHPRTGTGWIVVGLVVCFLMKTGTLPAQERYPDFDRAYWVQQQEAADAKIRRGAGLGVLGLASIAPTSMMIVRAVDHPQKYAAQSVVWGLVSLGAIGHGIGSVGFGRQQKAAAAAFVASYDAVPSTLDDVQERAEYLHGARKTRAKTLIFGGYLSAVAGVLLTNGIVQSVRRQSGADMDDIRIWPYYLAGGVLLPLGVAVIVLSGRALNRLDSLKSAADSSQIAFIAPFHATEITGGSAFGLSFAHRF